MTVDDLPFSKARQIERSTSASRCPRTGEALRACRCPSCTGRRSRAKGKAAQRTARKAAGVPVARWAGRMANEETWPGPFRAEVKSGAQVRPAWTAYLRAEAQAEAAKAEGDPRPFVAVLMPEGYGTEGLVLLRLSAWRALDLGRLPDANS